MNNVLITGPAGSGKSDLALHYAQRRTHVYIFDHCSTDLIFDDAVRHAPAATAIVLDEVPRSLLRDHETTLARLCATGVRLVVVAKQFSDFPIGLLTPLMRHGGMRDVALAIHGRSTTEAQLGAREQNVPPMSLAYPRLHAA
ncbi:hypothetical protein [Burkholderia sp. Ac-20365]|uniref:hypothetical protein n=1 Tax=Burkholderia sp. Ac-20365 TaxID=2703897 RepID=UPI00197BDCC4|nr:hypothetical protein [Burkholderia sp. Ac-20365]MBN3761300.1 hypothetical protein [Burkholderia sp. Ac-20365]